jgi:hypothetical protein
MAAESTNICCIICFDSVPKELLSECVSGHTTCNECLRAFIQVPNTLPENVSKCAIVECKQPLKLNMYVQEILLEQCHAKIRELTEANQSLQKAEAAETEKTLETILQKLQDCFRINYAESLVLKCPKCFTAFKDFDGCLSLLCGICKTEFCGLCLEVPGNTHAHIRNVHPGLLGGYFDNSKKTNFIEACKKRAIENLKEYNSILSGFFDGLFEDFARTHDFAELDKTKLRFDFINTFEKDYAELRKNFDEINKKYQEELGELQIRLHHQKSIRDAMKKEIKYYSEIHDKMQRNMRMKDVTITEQLRTIKLLQKSLCEYQSHDGTVHDEIDTVKKSKYKTVWCRYGDNCRHLSACVFKHTGDLQAEEQINPNDIKQVVFNTRAEGIIWDEKTCLSADQEARHRCSD